MSAQDVINQGNAIDIPHAMFHPDNQFWTMIALLLAFSVISVAISTVVEKKTKSRMKSAFALTLMLLITMLLEVGFLAISFDKQKTYEHAVKEWETGTANPYIQTQTYVDRELVSIEHSKLEYPLVKYMNDNQIIDTLSTRYNLSYDVPAGKQPFVRFYELKTDLGHGLDPGSYGLDVHLNKK